MHHHSRISRAARAFTLIELVVAVLVLGVIAAVIAPRLLDAGSRRAQENAREVVHLISVAARRDALGGRRQALEYDSAASTLSLLVLAAPAPDGRTPGGWRADPLAPTVKLEGVRLREAAFDGRRQDPRGWRMEFPETGPRPELELVLEPAAPQKIKTAWTIDLLPSASAAWMDDGASPRGQAAAHAGLRSIDLDASGKGQQAW